MNKDDRRVRKTKKALREALAELIMKRELHSITVRELTDTADVHRATFYSHYQDVYDLYQQIEGEALGQINDIIVNFPSNTYEGLLNELLEYIYSNAVLYRMFLYGKANHNFRDQIGRLLEERYLEICKVEAGINDVTEEWKFLARYHIQGCISVISSWVESGYSYPKDKIKDIMLRLDTHFDEIF